MNDTDTITPAVAAHRAAAELGELRDALALAVGRASSLSPDAEAALAEALALVRNTVGAFRLRLAGVQDDVDAAIEVAASRAAAAQDAEAVAPPRTLRGGPVEWRKR